MRRLEIAAEAAARRLAQRAVRVVLAESCTAGLAAAALAAAPGISEYLCGSAVVYRADTKVRWLGVDAAAIARHTAVSEQVTRQMAVGALERTAEAHLAAAITGHLGPDAPAELDGVVIVALAGRTAEGIAALGVWRHELEAEDRIGRQQEAAAVLLEHLAAALGA